MKLTNLYTYEVVTYYFDTETGEQQDNKDTHHLVLLEPLPLDLATLINLLPEELEGTYLEVFEARTATINLVINKNKEIVEQEVEPDFEGYYSSAIFTAYLDTEGNQLTYTEE